MRTIKTASTLLFAFLLTAGVLTFLARTQSAAAYTANGDAAHVVVQFGEYEQVVREIQITTPISGLLALQNTGLEIETRDFGGGFVAVCSINGVGCPADDCFCSSKFWSYEYWDGSAWQGYPVGATDSSVEAGDVEGWRWAEFGEGGLAPAPLYLAAAQGLDWLAVQQSITGTYGSTSANVEAMLAIGANGFRASEWRLEPEAVPLLSRILEDGAAFSELGASEAGKLAAGLAAADGCLPAGALAPSSYYSSTSGQYAEGTGFHVWGVLGTLALSETVPADAVQYLRDLVQPNGGWEWLPGFGTDTNSTALAIQALIAAGEPPTSTLVLNGLDYLKSAQNADGGFPYDPNSIWGTDSDTNSTAYAVQAIRAAGQDPLTGTWVISSTNPINYLLGMQLPDGSFEWQPGYGSNGLATMQASAALLGEVLPYRAAAVSACPALYLPGVENRLP